MYNLRHSSYAVRVAGQRGGIVIGRFMPPHRGHCYLIDFARSFTPDLTVFVCTLRSEPIPGDVRFAWMRTLFPDVRLVHITEEIPEAARSESGAQAIWAESVRAHLGADPQYVFASEEYGLGLAAALGARFVPVDPRRSLFPVSAAMIRSNPLAHWEYLPPVVRPYFLCRVSLAGAPGAAHAARELAGRFRTVHVADYAAYRRELGYPTPAIADPDELARAQAAAQTALSREANRVLFLETDLLGAIIGTGDPAALDRLAAGAYDGLLEANRPDAVIGLAALDPVYRRAAEKRGWAVYQPPAGAADPPGGLAAAEELIRTVLARHGRSGDR